MSKFESFGEILSANIIGYTNCVFTIELTTSLGTLVYKTDGVKLYKYSQKLDLDWNAHRSIVDRSSSVVFTSV